MNKLLTFVHHTSNGSTKKVARLQQRTTSVCEAPFTVIALLFAILLLPSESMAQASVPPLERSITITFQNERVDEALKRISHEAGVTFSYSAAAFDTQKTISKTFTSKSIREILEALFEGRVQYKQKGNYIILTKTEGGEGIVVSGYVVDESTGKKLKEVSIYDPISLKSTVTDEFGFFELEVNKPTNEDLQLAVKRSMYTDTLVVVPSKRSSFQNISLNIDEEKWKVFSDSIDSKLNRLWSWTQQSVQRINMQNIRDTIQRSWQISFVPFIGTNHRLSGNVVNDYSLNILGGYSAGTRKAELGGLFNINRGDVRFVQAAGLFNLTGGKTEGVQLAGFFNTNFDSTRAVQFAGLVNFNERSSEGAQFAGLSNFNMGSYQGPQFAGLFNATTGNVRGSQAAGLFNFTSKTMDGAQVAGLFNISKEVTGSQVASLFNISKTVHGSQVGLLNIADSVRGVPVGLLSFVNKGYHKLELAVDEVLPVNVALRTGVRQFYNILAVGVRPEAVDTVTWSFGYGVGVAPKLSKRLFLNVDVTSNQLVKGNVEALNLINKFYLGFDFQLTKKLSLTAGGTFNFRVYDPDFSNHAVLFDHYTPSLLSEGSFTGSTRYQTWWGAKVGVRFF